MNEMLDLALKYAAKGWEVFPIQKGTKTGYFRYDEWRGEPSDAWPEGNPYSWKAQASSDPVRVRRFWTDHPDANIGIATGLRSGGLFVIDEDEKDGRNGIANFEKWVDDNGRYLESGVMVKTPTGGRHEYFIAIDEEIPTREGWLPGVDIRGENNGYVLAPGSCVTDSNTGYIGSYEWITSPEESEIPTTHDPELLYIAVSIQMSKYGDVCEAAAYGEIIHKPFIDVNGNEWTGRKGTSGNKMNTDFHRNDEGKVIRGERHAYVISRCGELVRKLGKALSPEAIMEAVITDYYQNCEDPDDRNENDKTFRKNTLKAIKDCIAKDEAKAEAEQTDPDFYKYSMKAWREENPGVDFDSSGASWDDVAAAGLRAKEAGKVFDQIRTRTKDPPSVAAPITIDEGSGQLATSQDDRRDPELMTRTKKTARGEVEEVRQTISNCREAIAYDQELYGKLCYNELTFSPYVLGQLPWENGKIPREWDNADDSFLRQYLEKYGLTSEKKISDGFEIVVRSNPHNPIKDVLMAIRTDRWDGKTGHIRRLLPEYLGCEDTDYNYEVIKLVMVAAVKRIFQPGCKFDLVMVLVGPQGLGKSRFVGTLALNPEWYCDNFNSFEPELAVPKLRGLWIVEVGEMLAAKRAKEVESIKAFISSQNDIYREPYRQRTERRPRRCVFIGTTNDEGFLTDKTGNRRFLPIAAGVIKPTKSLFDDPDAVRTDFMNAWGEAFDYYLQDPDQDLILPGAVLSAAEEAQDRYTTDDVRIGMIQRYLDTRLKGYPVCAAELFQEALGNERLPVRHESNELHAIMQNLIPGWRKIDKRVRCDRYGPQWAYEKIPEVVPMEQEEFLNLDHVVRNPFELP